MIGDSEKDILAGKAVGLGTIKIGGYSELADLTKKNLLEALNIIFRRKKSSCDADKK